MEITQEHKDYLKGIQDFNPDFEFGEKKYSKTSDATFLWTYYPQNKPYPAGRSYTMVEDAILEANFCGLTLPLEHDNSLHKS